MVRGDDCWGVGCRLGIGLAFNPALAQFVTEHRRELDYIEVSPERFWHDRGPTWGGSANRYIEIPEAVEQLERARGDLPLVAHGVGLSVATSGPLDRGHVEQIARWNDRYKFLWFSEHLAYYRLGPDAAWRGIGVMLPPVYDVEALDDLRGKVHKIEELLGLEVLLENAVDFTPVMSAQMSEDDFLNSVVTTSRARLLLDLHNVYCNAINNGIDAEAFVDRLDLRHVHEIHIAGGEWLDGQWTDAHSGVCPEEVWKLLERVLSRPNGVRAITLEVDESYATRMADTELTGELDRARALWDLTASSRRADVHS